MRAVVSGSLSSLSIEVVIWGSNLTKFLCACDTKGMRSARNSTFFTHPLRVSTSTNEMETRVFPVPVAITNSPLRCLVLKCSQTAFIAIFW